MNKNVSVWRGDSTPPTNYHVWIKNDNSIYLHDGVDWLIITDKDTYKHILEFLEHQASFPKINTTDDAKGNTSILPKEFLIYTATKDIDVSNYTSFGKTLPFTIKSGDLYLLGKIKSEETLENPKDPRTFPRHSKWVNIVFDSGDLELGYDTGGNVKACARSFKPRWYLRSAGTNIYAIQSDKNYYLNWDPGANKYYLSSQSGTYFKFVLRDAAEQKYEIQRLGSSWFLNIYLGALLGNSISEWVLGDSNNFVYIIDPSLYELPKFNSNSLDLFLYKIRSETNKSFYASNTVISANNHSIYKLYGTPEAMLIKKVSANTFLAIKQMDIQYTSLANNLTLLPYGHESTLSFVICDSALAWYLNVEVSVSEGSRLIGYNVKTAKDNLFNFVPVPSETIIYRHIPIDIPVASSTTHGGIKISGTTIQNAAINSPSNVSGRWYPILTNSAGIAAVNVPWSDTTYNLVNNTTNGLMSSTDKNKLDGLAKVATSGNYNDLTNKPTIPASITEETVKGWGFTKNTGTYSKPADGIPVADLHQDILESLNNLEINTKDSEVDIAGTTINLTNVTATIPAATIEKAGVMTANDKKKLDDVELVESINWGIENNLDDYTTEGNYTIIGNHHNSDNIPILNDGEINARLNVLVIEHSGNKVVTQVLTLNNHAGGEGNVYIRSQQNGTWKPWGKLQTNVEVGQITPNDMSNLIDNGIYSGICVDGAAIETFVLIVINNYLAASQAGFGSYISQLKYSIDLTRGNTVKTRTRDAYGIWNDWSEIGGYVLPEATKENLGGVKLGVSNHAKFAPLTCLLGTELSSYGSGAVVSLDTASVINTPAGLSVFFDPTLTTERSQGLSVRLGTNLNGMSIIPCVLGSCVPTDLDGRVGYWENTAVGIPYNINQFILDKMGLQIKPSLIPAVVTWDANSNMNNYTTPGIYDIYGERTVKTDNLPITNDGSGHSIAARLTVIASTLQPNNTEKCITQFLQLSNRMGGEGNTYIRTYNENNNGLNGWSPWKKQQGMVESYINTDTVGITATGGQTTGLNGMTENGMYSGIYTDDYTLQSPTFVETFVLVVINDYAVSSQAGTPRRISQLKYATDTLTGQCTVKKRVGTGSDNISWGDWEEIGGGSSEVDNYLGIKSLTELRNDITIKSGIYYGLLSNSENAPFILEVSTNYDTGDVDDTEKMGIKKLTVGAKGNNCIEYLSKGKYENSGFYYNAFTRTNNLVVYKQCPSIRSCSYYTYIIINSYDLDELTIPATDVEGNILYQYIINTAKSIAGIKQVVINITPNIYNAFGGTMLGKSIVEVVYTANSSYAPVRYEKLLHSQVNGTLYKIQSITEFEKITI